MKRTTKKIIASAMAMTMCCGIFAESSKFITLPAVSAAVSDTLAMTENDIRVSMARGGMSSDMTVSGYLELHDYSTVGKVKIFRDIFNFSNSNIRTLDIYTPYFTFEAPQNTITSSNFRDILKIKISDGGNYVSLNPDDFILIKSHTQNGMDRFKLTVADELMIYGNTNDFQMIMIHSEKYNIKVKGAALKSSDNDKYYNITTSCNGDNILASVPYDSSVSTKNYEAWAKRICLYINSLKDITGISNQTLLISFRYVYMPEDAGAYCTTIYDSNKFATYGVFANETFKRSIKSGDNVIDWVELHEIGHAYGFATDTNFPAKFSENYSYNDEVYTNLRGLTALQNCNALKNTKIIYGDASYTNYSRAYRDKREGDLLFNYCKKYMTNVVNNFGSSGWYILEKFFSGVDYSNNFTSTGFKNALKTYASKTGLTTAAKPTYKLVNSLYGLYMISSEYFVTGTFESFVESVFGWSFIQSYAKSELKFSCDLNSDDKTDINDFTVLSLHLSGETFLNDYVLKRADLDSNGIVDATDLALLKEII